MYICCPLLSALYCMLLSLLVYTFLSCLQRFAGRNSSGRAPGKNKQRINLRLVFLKMQDYVLVTIHLL